MRLIVFKPKCIPKHSFYLDYPNATRNSIRFISTKEDLHKLQGLSINTKITVYAGLPFTECRSIIRDMKSKGLKVFNYNRDIELLSSYNHGIKDDETAIREREHAKTYTESI